MSGAGGNAEGGAPLPLHSLSGRFYRAIFARDRDRLLAGARSPEGRFHHDSQPALYLSSRPDWVAHAVARYVGAGDPQRELHEITLDQARIVDLRDQAQCALWGLAPAQADVPWMPERAAGRPATSWCPADQVRAGGADGMIYTARSAPKRWHLVLFRWHLSPRGAIGPTKAGAALSIPGRILPFRPV